MTNKLKGKTNKQTEKKQMTKQTEGKNRSIIYRHLDTQTN